MPIELLENRTLPITVNLRAYALVVRPITREEWLNYFKAVVIEETVEEGQITSTRVATPARIELLTNALVGANGYANDNELPDGWQQKIPLSHRAGAADLLFEVGPGLDIFSGPVSIGSERSVLNALWSLSEDGKGIVKHDGLVHTFKVPSADQQRRYSRDASRSVVSTGRRGTTRYLGAQSTLVDLYDELIVSVDGYTANGEPLNNRPDLIKQHMDAYHKAQAAGAIFQPVDARIHEEAK